MTRQPAPKPPRARQNETKKQKTGALHAPSPRLHVPSPTSLSPRRPVRMYSLVSARLKLPKVHKQACGKCSAAQRSAKKLHQSAPRSALPGAAGWAWRPLLREIGAAACCAGRSRLRERAGGLSARRPHGCGLGWVGLAWCGVRVRFAFCRGERAWAWGELDGMG